MRRSQSPVNCWLDCRSLDTSMQDLLAPISTESVPRSLIIYLAIRIAGLTAASCTFGVVVILIATHCL